MDLTKFDFPANNAIFHITKGLIFNRNIAFKVRALFPDKNDKNIPIQNEERLKHRLFEKIRKEFNDRLDANRDPSNYQFTDEYKKRMRITLDKFDQLKLQQFQLSSGLDDEYDTSQIGGDYVVYPLTFVCKKCGDLQVVRQKIIDKFNPNKCVRCDGEYEQLSLMLFCETCGNIRPFQYSYQGEPITLIRGSKDSISTWKVRAKSQPPIDIFRLPCKHWDPFDFSSRRVISNADQCQQRTLTVTEGSIYIPRADTSIDIPTSPDINIQDLEYILNGISLGKFDFFEDLDMKVTLETIQELYEAYNNTTMKDLTAKRDPKFKDKTDDEIERLWKEFNYIDKIEEIVEKLKEIYPPHMLGILREINDFSALIGKLHLKQLKISPYSNYLDKIDNIILRKEKEDAYRFIKQEFKIDNIIHIPSVTLINSCYGIINGINKFYEPGFIPHFDPIWINRTDPNKGFYAYSYPYETEGIVITVDKEAIVKWLLDCDKIVSPPQNIGDFFNILDFDSYIAVMTLLHTLSHLIMRNSSVFTGLDLQSYGEIIFPTSAAIFIFSTSSINIGGLQFVFENEIFNWFENIKYDVKECTLDPSCLKDKGACFSCMYVPEFVCSLFNQYLDRDVFMGKSPRYKAGFWG
ncbi:MAG: hypothetical protein ACFFFT_00150 [Candidatus Thorarchaeota archaeon]